MDVMDGLLAGTQDLPPVDIAGETQEAEDHEIPLPEDDERLLRIISDDIETSKKLQAELASRREEQYQLYRGKSLGNEREGRSQIVSADVLNTVEWIMPSMMRIFFSGDSIVACDPMGPEDAPAAERISTMLNDQFVNRNNGYMRFYSWIKAALVYGMCPAKVSWGEDWQLQEFAFPELAAEDLQEFIDDPECEIDSYSEEQIPFTEQELQALSPQEMQAIQQGMAPPPSHTVFRDVRGRRPVMVYSGPKVEILPPEDYLYDPDCTDQADAKYEIHRCIRTLDDLRQMEIDGVYRNVDQVEQALESRKNGDESDNEKQARYTEDDRTASWLLSVTKNEDQPGREQLIVYEWWGDLTMDDGSVEPYLVVTCGDVVLRAERNPYNHGRSPFVVLCPILDLFKLEGIGMADLVGEFQRVKTSIRRQMLDNLSFQNNQMWEVDRNVRPEMSSLLNPRPGGVVRVDRLGGIRALTPPPLTNVSMQALEFEQTQLEQATGITRYNQGLDATSLNKTATGITAIMGASQQRLELIARTFAETGVRSLFRMMLALNQQYMDHEYTARVYGEVVRIAPDDIRGLFDISVSVGISAGRQEQTQSQMMQLVQMAPGLIQSGVMTPDNVYEVLKKLMQSWGHKDVNSYITEPHYMEQMQMQLQQVSQQAQQAQQQAQQAQQILQMLPPEILQQAQQVLQQQMAQSQAMAQQQVMQPPQQAMTAQGQQPQAAPPPSQGPQQGPPM